MQKAHEKAENSPAEKRKTVLGIIYRKTGKCRLKSNVRGESGGTQ